MQFTNTYRAMAAGFAAFLLTACAAQDTSESGEDEAQDDGTAASTLSVQSLEMAETAWLSVSEAGEVFTTYLDPDGRYRDERSGRVVYRGAWEQNENRELCFLPTTGEGDCWVHRSPGLNGVMRATNSAGRAIEVKRVTYTAPAVPPAPEPQDDTPSSDQDDAPGKRG